MSELLFVEYSNKDQLGRRVIGTDFKTTNIYFSVADMDDDKINKLCGLSTKDVDDIKLWLKGKGYHAENSYRQPDRLL